MPDVIHQTPTDYLIAALLGGGIAGSE